MSIFKLRIPSAVTLLADEQAVRTALGLFADRDHAVFIQVLPSAAYEIVAGDNLDAMVATVGRLASRGGQGLYWGLNPVPVGLGRPTRSVDAIRRRWLLIDVDTVRADPESNATDAEKEAARQVAQAVQSWLIDNDWPAPIIVDSGNGWHLLYRVDLPNSRHAQVLVRRAIQSISETFDSEQVKIDRKVHDARRISKLPGTWARKGPTSDERPHRECKVWFRPESIEVVTAEQLGTVGGYQGEQPAEGGAQDEPTILPMGGTSPSVGSSLKQTATGSDRLSYARKALDGECARVKLAIPGASEGRNNALNCAAFRMGQLVGGGCIDGQEVERRLTEAGVDCGLGPVEVARTIGSGLQAGKGSPREPAERPNPAQQPERAASDAIPITDSIIVRASTIQPKKVEWLWPGRIPLGKLTTFAGVGGLGKTFVLCDLAARVSRGDAWPDSGGECHTEPGQVLFISGEDDVDDTLVPRLIECGADLSKICFLKTEVQDRFTLADLKTLNRAIAEMGVAVRFVAIDPPTAYLGGVDDHKNAELRGLLGPLKSWAAKHKVALVFNTHVNKPQGAKVEAMMRVMGSVAWVNAVRAAIMFAKDPEDPERRLFVGMKNNLAKERKGLAYKIAVTKDDLAKVEWLGEVDVTADEAVNRESKQMRRDVQAATWLIERFKEKREWESDLLFETARQAGISRSAIFQAKTKLCLPRARKVTHQNGDYSFVWWVPPDWPALHEDQAQGDGSQQVADEASFGGDE